MQKSLFGRPSPKPQVALPLPLQPVTAISGDPKLLDPQLTRKTPTTSTFCAARPPAIQPLTCGPGLHSCLIFRSIGLPSKTHSSADPTSHFREHANLILTPVVAILILRWPHLQSTSL